MKYKVVKEFDSLKKGDILENSTEEPEIFAFEEETDNSYKYVSYNQSIIDDLVKNKYLTLIEVKDVSYSQSIDEDECCEECTCAICKAVDEIDRMLKQYEEDNATVAEKFANNEVPYCAKVEADTVHANLTLALNHIKDILVNE